jgi:hypothetical protein
MKPRYALKLDGTHTGIKDALESAGNEVIDCSGSGSVPDLLVRNPNGMIGWIEAKAVTKALFTHKQLTWISRTRFPVAIVNNSEDALEFAATHQGGLSQQEKDRLAVYLMQNVKRLHTPKQVMGAIGR